MSVTEKAALQHKVEAKEAPETWEELMGQDLLIKTTVSKKDAQAVQPQDVVVVDFYGYQADDTVAGSDGLQVVEGDDPSSRTFIRADAWMIVVGEKDVVAGLEMGIRFMSEGETAELYCHSKYAYGPGERRYHNYCLPPNSNVKFIVTVRSILSSEQQQSIPVQLQLARSKKNIANDIYQHETMEQDFARGRALYIYQRAAQLLEQLLLSEQQPQQPADTTTNDDDDDNDDTNDIQTTTRQLLLDVLNNVAAVQLKAKRYRDAKQACVTVLERDPTNAKALLRAAKCCLLDPASSYTEAEAAIRAAQPHIDPSLQGPLQKLRADLIRQRKRYQKRERALYQKMAPNTTTHSPASSSKAPLETGSSTSNDKHIDDSVSQWKWRERILPYSCSFLLLTIILCYTLVVALLNNQRHDSDNEPNEL